MFFLLLKTCANGFRGWQNRLDLLLQSFAVPRSGQGLATVIGWMRPKMEGLKVHSIFTIMRIKCAFEVCDEGDYI